MVTLRGYEAETVKDLIDCVFNDGNLLNQLKEIISEEDGAKLDIAIRLTFLFPPPSPTSPSPAPPTHFPTEPIVANAGAEEERQIVVDLALLFDCSRPMLPHLERLQTGQEGLISFIKNCLKVNLRLAIIAYDQDDFYGESFDNDNHASHLNDLVQRARNNMIDHQLYQPNPAIGLLVVHTLQWMSPYKVLYHLAPNPLIPTIDGVNAAMGILNGQGVVMSSGHTSTIKAPYRAVGGDITVHNAGLVKVDCLMESIKIAVGVCLAPSSFSFDG